MAIPGLPKLCRGVWFPRDVDILSPSPSRCRSCPSLRLPWHCFYSLEARSGLISLVIPRLGEPSKHGNRRMRSSPQTPRRRRSRQVPWKRTIRIGCRCAQRKSSRQALLRLPQAFLRRTRQSKARPIQSWRPARPTHSQNQPLRFWTCGRWCPLPACRWPQGRRIHEPVLTRCDGFRPWSRGIPRLPRFRLREQTKAKRTRPLPRRDAESRRGCDGGRLLLAYLPPADQRITGLQADMAEGFGPGNAAEAKNFCALASKNQVARV